MLICGKQDQGLSMRNTLTSEFWECLCPLRLPASKLLLWQSIYSAQAFLYISLS